MTPPSHDPTPDNPPGSTTSLWMSSARPTPAGRVTDVSAVDVCIIGAGIAGLSTAYECLSRGMTVAVLESNAIGSGESLRTSAHLANGLDDRFARLRRLHGKKGAQMLASAHGEAISWIEAVCLAESIDCDFARVPGYLFGREGTSRRDMEDELAAAQDAGLDAALVEEAPLASMGTLPAIRFEAQAEFHMGKYLAGLAAAVLRKGGAIFEGVHVEQIDEEPVTNGGATVTTRDGHELSAKHVVVATNAPISSMVSVPLRQTANRSYVIALDIPAGTDIPHALYWDMEEPYHYVRVVRGDEGQESLIVGGEDHKTGQETDTEARFALLESWARTHLPLLGDVSHRWSGQIMEPADGVGFVGRQPGGDGDVYVITGDSGNGLTLGTAGARIVADMMERKENPHQAVFDPSRLMLRALGTLLSENANVAAQYTDLVASGEVESEEHIAPGEGAIVRDGLSLLAVYRGEDGVCHTRSALCTHLGGVVHWNAVENSWDCPCHGSRFDARGRVIAGPAVRDLDGDPHARSPRS